jgi:hypothetical protein
MFPWASHRLQLSPRRALERPGDAEGCEDAALVRPSPSGWRELTKRVRRCVSFHRPGASWHGADGRIPDRPHHLWPLRVTASHFQPYFGKPWSLQMTSSIPEPRPPSPRQRSASKRVPDDTSLLRRARNRSASPARWAVRSRQIARSIRNGKNQRLCARDRVPRPSTLTNSGAQIERSYRGLLHHKIAQVSPSIAASTQARAVGSGGVRPAREFRYEAIRTRIHRAM